MAAGDLITHAQAERYLRRMDAQLTGEADDDADIDELITSASLAISNYCQREFVTIGSSTKTRTFSYDGSGSLSLKPYDLRAATTVTLYPDLDAQQQQALATNSYRLGPLNGARGGTYLWIEMPKFRHRTPYYSFDTEISVAGTWGMAAVPEDVQQACKVAVHNWYLNPANMANVSAGGESMSEFFEQGSDVTQSLPRGVRGLLTPYRRLGRRV